MDSAQLPQEPLKAPLLQHDETFRRLAQQHQHLDEHVRRLSSLSYLTVDQQAEEVALKKRKLAIKDQMEAWLRANGSVSESA